MSGFTVVGFFLVSVFFSLVIATLWFRIALRYFKVSALNPVGRSIISVTNPLVKPLNYLFRQHYKPGQRYDVMAFIVLFLVEWIKIMILSLLAFHQLMPGIWLMIYVLADLIIQPCNILFYAILIRVIMSYVQPYWQNPIADFLVVLTEPCFRMGRKIVSDAYGFDFSPFIIMIILKAMTLFISASLPFNLL